MTTHTPIPTALPAATVEELRELQAHVGLANAAKGFHDRSESLRERAERLTCAEHEGCRETREDADDDLRDHQVATAALIVTEATELIEELRDGHAADETYYLGNESTASRDGKTKYSAATVATMSREGQVAFGISLKPEGVPSELADIVIRSFDFAHRFGIDLAAIIDEKLAFNATRGRMHGGKKL